jgi:hypothetical protein
MYDAADDPYTYENSTVLINKLDLRDQRLHAVAGCSSVRCASHDDSVAGTRPTTP